MLIQIFQMLRMLLYTYVLLSMLVRIIGCCSCILCSGESSCVLNLQCVTFACKWRSVSLPKEFTQCWLSLSSPGKSLAPVVMCSSKPAMIGLPELKGGATVATEQAQATVAGKPKKPPRKVSDASHKKGNCRRKIWRVRRQRLCNHFHCKKGETKVPHCRFKVKIFIQLAAKQPVSVLI